MKGNKKIVIAFVAGLSDKKLRQKLEPLASLKCVHGIDLYRRSPFVGLSCVRWRRIPRLGQRFKVLGELMKLCLLLVNGWRYDVFIGCFQRYHGLWAHIAARVWRKPVIQMVITDPLWNMRFWPARIPMMRADACAVRGNIAMESLRNLGYTGPVAVIHNPMSLPRGCDNVQKRYDIIAVGNCVKEKDYPWMLVILEQVRKSIPDLSVLFCGDGFERLQDEINRRSLEKTIQTPGYLHGGALNEAYAQSKVFLMTSNVEGLPMALVEALSHGLPIFATSVGEIPSIIETKIQGVLFRSGDTGYASMSLVAALTNKYKRFEYGQESFKLFSELQANFSLNSINERWIFLFCSVFKSG